ncbi:MAG: ABC transporter substrate-binding protein [Candidatus Omnitrophota bacterium]
MMKKGLIPLLLIVLLFAAGCGHHGEETEVAVKAEKEAPAPETVKEEPAAETGPIKIGAIFGITGPASKLGEPERNTVEMLVEKINASGGVNGRTLEVIIEDTEGAEQKAVEAVNKLLEKDGVCAIIGPTRSGPSMAVIPIMQKNETPLISCAAADSIVEPIAERKWIFKTPQKNSSTAIQIFNHMKTAGITKVAIITGTTGFGKEGRDQLLRLAPTMGITIVADETYNPPDTDMTAQLTKIKGTDAQAVINWSIVPGQSIVPKNMKQLGMTIPLYQSHGFGNIAFANAAGDAAEGIIFPAGALLVADQLPETYPRKAFLLEYKKDYEAKYGGEVSTFGGHAYDALMLLVEAIKTVGTDKAAIRDQLEKIQNFVGTAGVFNMTPEDHTGLGDDAFELITVKGGKFVLLQ